MYRNCPQRISAYCTLEAILTFSKLKNDYFIAIDGHCIKNVETMSIIPLPQCTISSQPRSSFDFLELSSAYYFFSYNLKNPG
jgi:hypothetical protein